MSMFELKSPVSPGGSLTLLRVTFAANIAQS